jgi:PAS domain S-box-containing protein
MLEALPQSDLLPVFNALPGANLLLSPGWVIVAASDDYLAATLTERVTIVGQYIFDAFPDNPQAPEANAVANVRASLTQVLATKQPHEMAPQHYDVPNPARPGQFVERHWQPRHTPVLDETGQVQFIIQSVQDITASRVAQRQLRESQASEQVARADAAQQRADFQYFIEQAPVAVAVYHGPEFRIEMANATTLAIWGRPLEAVLHRPVFEVLPEAATPDVVALFEYVFSTGTPRTYHEQPTFIDRHGQRELVYWNMVFEPQRDADGRVNGIFTVGTDVTEQVLARQQVEQLNQELEARVQERTQAALTLQTDLLAAAQQQADQRALLYQVFEQTPAAICLQRGPEHRYEYVNAAYQAFFPGREFMGRPVAEALPETLNSGVVALLDHVYQTGETYYGYELPLLIAQPDGQPPKQMYFTFTYQAYRENGEIVGISTFAYNVAPQVLARQKQQAQQQKLYALLEQAPVGVAIQAGPDLVYEFANPAYQRLVPGRQLLGRPFFEVFSEMAGTNVEVLLRRAYETGETQQEQNLRIPVARADGSPKLEDRYFTLVYQARRDEQGLVNGVMAFIVEMTEQARARAQVEQSAQQVRTLVESAPFPIGMHVGPEFRIQLANQAMVDGWGKGPDVIGKRFGDVLPEFESQAVIDQMRQVWNTGEALHLRNQRLEMVINGTPQIFYYNYGFTPLRTAEGQVYGILNTAADVTDLALARERIEAYAAELQESEARFRTMADAAPNLVWAVQPNSAIRYINRAFLDFVGLDNEEQYAAVGWGPYLHPDELALTRDTLAQAIAQRQPYVLEHRMRRHDGQYRWLLAQGAPSYLAGGELYGYVGSAIDITDLKQANEQLRRTNIDLDNFIYTASHDLKQPIANIEGLLHAIQHELPPAGRVGEVPIILELMQAAIERFSRTIAHLTDISRLQQEHNQPASLVLLPRLVQEILLDLAPLQAQTQANIDVRIPEDAILRFSEKNLRSVVYNLLSNAMKYRHPDRAPAVRITYTRQPAAHLVEVHDNGLGLNVAQDGDKLFGMFTRLHMHVEGTGIGLYMVKKMVENAGGRIEVASTLGQGSTFRVYLPR